MSLLSLIRLNAISLIRESTSYFNINSEKRSIHIIDLNKKIKENVSEETIKNLIKFSKKQVNTDNDVFSKKVTNDYIVTVDNIFPEDIIIEKVNSLERDSIKLLLFKNSIFIKKYYQIMKSYLILIL